MKVTVKKSRTRFIAIAAALICTLSLTACNSNGTSSQTESSNTVNSSVSADSSSSNNSYEAWSDEIVLSNIIPEVKGTVDHTYENTEEELWITFKSVDDSQYKDYLTACKNRGFTVEEIANTLFRSIATIKTYKRRLFKKLAVSNMSEARAISINYQLNKEHYNRLKLSPPLKK